MREIINILYNENYHGVRDALNNLSSEDIVNIFDAIKGVKNFNSDMVYNFLYFSNEMYGTCDNIYHCLGNKTSFNKDNVLYALEECYSLCGEKLPNIHIAREQIEDYEKNYGWNLTDTFLFPCNGSHYILITVSKLMNSDKHIQKFNDEYERYKHIIENQIYIGNDKAINNFHIACVLDINNEFNKNIFTGDIFSLKFNKFRHIKYTAAFGEAPAHNGKIKRSLNYIFHNYIKKCVECCRITCLLTPARWFQTDSGDFKYLIKFREDIRNSNKIKLLNYYPIQVDIEHTGGLSYLIIDTEYNGICLFKKEGLFVDLSVSDIILKSAYHYRLINKCTLGKCMDSVFITNSWADIKTNDNRLLNEYKHGAIKVYVSRRHGHTKWISNSHLKKNELA